MSIAKSLGWAAVAVVGAFALALVATARGEPVNAAWLVIAAACTYTLGYRFYSRFIALKVLRLSDENITPAHRLNDGRDFVPTNRWVVFGHHFAAIAGPGPLVGPIMAAQFGYLPGTLWILIGVVLGGAVQDFVSLGNSLRRDGRSLTRMAEDYLGGWGARAAALGILLIMLILMAVLAVVVVNALAESPWGVFTVGATIPIALLMGVIMRGGSTRAVWAASVLGVGLLLLAVWGGHWVSTSAAAPWFTLTPLVLCALIVIYAFSAAALPVWLLLAPRDYLSTFVKLGVVAVLAVGILLVRPDLHLPPLTKFIDGTGPFFGGKVFPFCFITIACGAISGFHALVASGTTPKMLDREGDARMIGYGSMLLESCVAVMAIIAAASLSPGQFFAINSTRSVEWITAQGFPVTAEEMAVLASEVGESSVQGRSGGGACFAVGMAHIFQQVVGGRELMGFWYHFAIMFEALFILTTLDAGTRVGRYLLQDTLARRWTWIGGSGYGPGLVATGAIVVGWGYFAFGAVLDPKAGGIRALWPLFGIANQLLAVTALTIATTILVRTGRTRYAWVTGMPLAFLIAVTLTGGMLFMFHPDPGIGQWARADAIADGTIAAAPGLKGLLEFNARLAVTMAGVFIGLVVTVVVSAARRWSETWTGALPPEPDGPSGAPPAPTRLSSAMGSRSVCC